MSSPKAFAKLLSKTLKNLDSDLGKFLEDPNANNVHDIRTGIRRTQSLLKLLPKSLRSRPKVTAYLERAKPLFRATTPIRDIDIIAVNLSKFESVPEVMELLAGNERKRIQHLRKAKRLAVLFEKTPMPRVRASQMPKSKLLRRRSKVMRELQDNLNGQSPIVLSNPTHDQLHEFRKTCKMLRYTLEFDRKEHKKLIETLVQIQRTLGTLMDIQVTIKYISESSMGEGSKQITDGLNEQSVRASDSFRELFGKRFLPMIRG